MFCPEIAYSAKPCSIGWPAGEALPPDASPTIAETWREMENLVEIGTALGCRPLRS